MVQRKKFPPNLHDMHPSGLEKYLISYEEPTVYLKKADDTLYTDLTLYFACWDHDTGPGELEVLVDALPDYYRKEVDSKKPSTHLVARAQGPGGSLTEIELREDGFLELTSQETHVLEQLFSPTIDEEDRESIERWENEILSHLRCY